MAKTAFLVDVNIMTRVIVDCDSPEESVWEKAGKIAIEKILENPREYICLDNVGDVYDDTECPYDPQHDC